MTKQQLEQSTFTDISRQIQIANDCVYLVKTTSSPRVFFERYDLYLQCTRRIIELQKYMRNANTNIYEQQQFIIHQFTTLVDGVVQRAWAKVIDDCEKRKTERGKLNRKIKFFDEFIVYKDRYPPTVKNRLSALWNNSFYPEQNAEIYENPKRKIENQNLVRIASKILEYKIDTVFVTTRTNCPDCSCYNRKVYTVYGWNKKYPFLPDALLKAKCESCGGSFGFTFYFPGINRFNLDDD